MGRALPCRDKIRFATGSKARRYLRNVKRLGFHDGDHGKPQRAYACTHCGGYHLTSWGAGDER